MWNLAVNIKVIIIYDTLTWLKIKKTKKVDMSHLYLPKQKSEANRLWLSINKIFNHLIVVLNIGQLFVYKMLQRTLIRINLRFNSAPGLQKLYNRCDTGTCAYKERFFLQNLDFRYFGRNANKKCFDFWDILFINAVKNQSF